MKRLTDPRLQRLMAYVSNDQTLSASATSTLSNDLMALDAELLTLRQTAKAATTQKVAR